jgi:outer membrane protein assembly factor BamE (lipoprotein component of BamABCDE complex)
MCRLRLLRLLLLTLLPALPLAACELPDFMSFPPQVRGNKVDPELLAQLVPGTSTRADATSLIGSPTAKATFDDNTWIYIGEVTKPVLGGFNAVRDQEVVVLTFDQGGILRKVERKGLDDAQSVAMESRTTPAPGTEASILQQLLGNVGRYNPSPVGALGGGGGSQSHTNPGNF